MGFPETERVIYGRNPLVEVICQLRFPTILKIEAEAPAAFQDAIRRDYPELQQQQQVVKLPNVPVLQQALTKMSALTRMTHEFISADGQWKVSLVREFIALSTTSYERWEEFRERLDQVVGALASIYEPAFFSRVGLRYRDVISRSMLGLEGVDWAELLTPALSAELSDRALRASVTENVHQVLFSFPELGGDVRLQHGLAVDEEREQQQVYVIDADFYTQARVPPGEELALLDRFNRQAGCLFRWCIQPRLHEAMQPEGVA